MLYTFENFLINANVRIAVQFLSINSLVSALVIMFDVGRVAVSDLNDVLADNLGCIGWRVSSELSF